jgi:hypothetical protein
VEEESGEELDEGDPPTYYTHGLRGENSQEFLDKLTERIPGASCKILQMARGCGPSELTCPLLCACRVVCVRAEVSNSWISKFVNPPAFGVEVLLDILNDKQQKER